jgi:3-hydroxyacyl-CoA dehydrogenase/enoyl-CoA hydratase/3-hydroxybutyryl-CoA epimerase/enoyl-CoA isomerase
MLFEGRTLKLLPVETDISGIVELRFDRTAESVNKLDRLAFEELRQAIDLISGAQNLRGLLITSAKDAFIVGADIFEFTGVFEGSEQAVAGFVGANSAIVTALGDLPLPSVAAINGLALGGGLEVALAADFRVIATTAKVGVPEIHLGLFPGYGGTVRLPRLIGLAAAAQWIISGAQNSADAALSAGAVDAATEPAGLEITALALLAEAIEGRSDWRNRRADLRKGLALTPDEIANQLAGARAEAAKALPHYPAAGDAVALLEETANLDRDHALGLEAERFARTAKTQAAASLVTIFINDQAVKKIAKTKAKAARPVRKAAVIGAGIMGGGIACQSALRGTPILMKDIAQSSLDLGIAEAKKLLARQVEQGRLPQTEADRILAAILPTLDYDGIGQADVVIEAVVEELAVKQRVFADIEARVGEDVILASNTSSLRIGDLAAGLRRPDRFGGMHFFNPVAKMALVEVVHGTQTSNEALATLVGFAIAMGKTPIVVADCPGFIVNRILTPYFIGFLQLVHDGIRFTDIDKAMEDFGWPMGPAYLADVIGMDISNHVVEIVSAGFPDHMQVNFPSPFATLLKTQRLGQKNGRGFYRYERDAKGRPRKTTDPEAEALVSPGRIEGQAGANTNEIVERMMLPLVLEAARCLEDEIAATPGEIDMCLVLGLGLPRYLGGALKYADHLGLAHVVELCGKWGHLGPIYRPSEAMLARAARGAGFYSNEPGTRANR